MKAREPKRTQPRGKQYCAINLETLNITMAFSIPQPRIILRIFWIISASILAIHLILYSWIKLVSYQSFFSWKEANRLNDVVITVLILIGILCATDFLIWANNRLAKRRFAQKFLKLRHGHGLTECPLCKEQIIENASICKHCKSDLTWRRHVQIGQTTLALLTALIAVTGAVAPNIKRALESSHSQVRYTIISTTPESLTLMVTNDGPEIGQISGLRIAVTFNDTFNDTKGIIFLNYEPENNAPVLIKSKTTEQVIYKLTEDYQLDQQTLLKITPEMKNNFYFSLHGSECIGKLSIADDGEDQIARYYCKAEQFKLPLLVNRYR